MRTILLCIALLPVVGQASGVTGEILVASDSVQEPVAEQPPDGVTQQAEPSSSALPSQTPLSEDSYVPPVPRTEKRRQVVRRHHCCPEPHCCDVEKMVVESKGKAEAELAKAVGAAAVLGGEQAEYERNANERHLRSRHKDEESSVNVTLAQAAADSHIVETEVAALERELEDVKKQNEKLEDAEDKFNEKLIERKEEEVGAAERDLLQLEAEKHSIAEAIEKEIKRIEDEEKAADIEVSLANARKTALAHGDTEEEVEGQLKALEEEAKREQDEGAQRDLNQTLSELSKHREIVTDHAQSILNNADNTLRSITTEHPNIAAAEQEASDRLHKFESVAAVAEHEAKAEEAQAESEPPSKRELANANVDEDGDPQLVLYNLSLRPVGK
ncbi:hypothetical protein BESB_063140 [Besnoitia besnoiti]|uniref:Uncharacterized protein n=1 Tax=Besnoitia besnoiti TaxID=94643 RepID=A0A2A9MIL8_BESBE|nr:hypothetical protein BESB_063140 [Besnoitia besnoiti]PFH35427.1 hypothetical protein BESB_063140 [Besnoitia besnoiti]